MDQDTVPSETPASNETLKEQMILGDVAVEPADRIRDESSRLLQDSLQVLKKKKGDKPRVKRKVIIVSIKFYFISYLKCLTLLFKILLQRELKTTTIIHEPNIPS